MRTCKTCGNQFSNNSRICSQCGCLLPNYDIDAALATKHSLVLKTDMKKLWLGGLIGGLIFGLFFFLMIEDFLTAMLIGLCWGVLFSGTMHIITMLFQKKYDKISHEIAQRNTIIVEGAVTTASKGGCLFITDEGVEFHPNKANCQRAALKATHKEIQAIAKEGKKIAITVNNQKRLFIVNKVDAWLSQINFVYNP